MDKYKGCARTQIVSLFIISQLMIISTIGDGGGAGLNQGSNPVERGINYKNPFEKLTSLIKLAWNHLRIPDSEIIKKEGSKAGEHVKNAAVESFEKSEETAERSAKGAGDAVHEAAEKIKGTIPHHHGRHNGL